MRTTGICGIYALIDPRNDKVMYIGKSIDIEYRYRQHTTKHGADMTMKGRWVRELEKAGLRPEMEIIERCEVSMLDELEIKYISHYKKFGLAEMNSAVGGSNSAVCISNNSHPDDWLQLCQQVMDVYYIYTNIIRSLSKMVGISKSEKYMKRFDKIFFEFKMFLQNEMIRKFPHLSIESIDKLSNGRNPDDPDDRS